MQTFIKYLNEDIVVPRWDTWLVNILIGLIIIEAIGDSFIG